MRIPRKNGQFAPYNSSAEDVAFGVEAGYALSFAMLVIYHVIPIILAFGFWIYWLKNHPDDLQNASVPTFTVLNVMAVFWWLLGRQVNIF